MNIDTLLLALPLIFSAAFGVAAAYELWIEARLRTSGVTAKGRVLELRSDSRFGLTYAFIEYSYRIDGQDYMAHQAITGGHYERLVEGVAVDIAYLAATPAVARLFGEDFDNANRKSLTIRALMCLGAWAVLLAYSVAIR